MQHNEIYFTLIELIGILLKLQELLDLVSNLELRQLLGTIICKKFSFDSRRKTHLAYFFNRSSGFQ